MTKDHKQEFLDSLKKSYQEHIWKDEINQMEYEEMIGALRTELAEIDLKLERKEFESAGEGRKAYEQKKAEIAAITASLDEVKNKLVHWPKRIELINRYESA